MQYELPIAYEVSILKKYTAWNSSWGNDNQINPECGTCLGNLCLNNVSGDAMKFLFITLGFCFRCGHGIVVIQTITLFHGRYTQKQKRLGWNSWYLQLTFKWPRTHTDTSAYIHTHLDEQVRRPQNVNINHWFMEKLVFRLYILYIFMLNNVKRNRNSYRLKTNNKS